MLETTQLPVRKKIAVLLNGNARKVSTKVAGRIGRVLPTEDIFYSRTLEEGISNSRSILRSDYDTVFTGGGDGTLVGFLSEMFAAERNPLHPYPAVGVLKLGTGNAVAGLLGSHPKILPDLDRASRGVGMWALPRPMVMCNGKCAPFAGMGVDADILNSYYRLKRRLEGTRFAWLGNGPLGYFLSISMDVIPRYLFGNRDEVEVINEGERAHAVNPDGTAGRVFGRGDVLYRGPASIAGVATVPCFGYSFRAFPYAESSGERLNVRIFSGGSFEAVTNLRKVWKGEYRSPSLLDFYADKVTMRTLKPAPLQIGGDPSGMEEEATFQVTPRPVDLIKFLPPTDGPAN